MGESQQGSILPINIILWIYASTVGSKVFSGIKIMAWTSTVSKFYSVILSIWMLPNLAHSYHFSMVNDHSLSFYRSKKLSLSSSDIPANEVANRNQLSLDEIAKKLRMQVFDLDENIFGLDSKVFKYK